MTEDFKIEGNRLISYSGDDTVITLPDNIKSIDEYAFEKSDKLSCINVNSTNPYFSSADGILYNKNQTEIIYVPLGIKGDISILKGVTSIGTRWGSIYPHSFKNRKELTGITIPDSITKIGEDAFKDCSSLKNVVLPDNIKSIEYGAFCGCSSLESITIPESVTEIGEYTFSGCSSLKNIVLPDNITSIKYGVFNGCSSLESITIPKSVTEIGEDAFKGCSSLESITIPESVTEIGENAFGDCISLKNIVLPDNITSIKYGVFNGCSSLESITIPESVTEIEEDAFSGCISLKNIVLPDNITSIKKKVFYKCSSLESIKIPDGVTEIGEDAFCSCNSLKNIVLPDNITSIGNGVFYKCSSLESITIPDGVVKINYKTFYGCENLKHINLSDNITSIDGLAFSECCSMEELRLPEKLSEIKDGAFVNCKKLNKVIVPDSNSNFIFQEDTLIDREKSRIVFASAFIKKSYIPDYISSIASYAFSGCNELKEINIPKSVEKLTFEEFIGCDNLENINIDESNPNYTSIDGAVYSKNKEHFLYCPKKKINYKVPDGTVIINDFAFQDCKELEKLELADSITRIGRKAFAGCSSMKSFTVPLGMSEISGFEKTSRYSWDPESSGMFEDCDSLETIYIHEHVSKIGHCTFLKCKNLKKIYFGNTKIKITVFQFDSFEQLERLTSSFYPSQLDSDMKSSLMPDILEFLLDSENKDVDEKWRKAWIRYLKTTRNDHDYDVLHDSDYLQVMINEKIIDPVQFSRLEEQAGKDSLDDVLKKLKDYKDNNFSDKDLKKAATKKPVHENKNTLTYMKKIWGFKVQDDDTLMITSYKGDEPDVVVPSEIGKNKVTVIAADTFNPWASRISSEQSANRKKIKSIIIPESVIKIDETFMNHDNLEKVIINARVESLPNTVFCFDKKLTEVKLPDTLTKLDSYHWNSKAAFSYCESLESIDIPDSVTEIESDVFYNCKKLKSVKLPKMLKKIGSNGFCRCESLESIDIPDCVTYIGGYAFDYCNSLKELKIPEGVKTLEMEGRNSCTENVVSNCNALERVFIPASLERIQSFKSFKNLYDIVVDENNQNYISIDGVLYSKDLTTLICVPQKKSEVTIPSSVTVINKSAFAYCELLSEITIPGSVTKIGKEAFYGCSALKKVNITNSIYEIEAGTFADCKALSEITIPESVTKIGKEAFCGCTALESINIPSSVTVIDSRAFASCKSLSEVVIPENVTELGYNIFCECENIKSFIAENKELDISYKTGLKLHKYVKTIFPSQLDNINKSYMIYDVVNIILSEKDVDSQWKEAWVKYLKSRKRYLYDSIIGNENMMKVMTSEKLLTIDDVKALIKITNEKSMTDITALLLDYQNKTFSMEDILKSTEKSLTKGFSTRMNSNSSKEDPSSASYLKKIWTTKKLDDGTLEIVNYKGDEVEIEVPAVIGKTKVSSIGEFAFSPDGKRLAEGQEELREKITSIKINDGITKIAPSAFYNCRSLKTLKLPNDITEIKGWVHETGGRFNCKEYHGLLDGCCCMTDLEIPSCITKLGDYAFYKSSLETITLSDNITEIGDNVFEDCCKLNKIKLPDCLVSIGNRAFYSCRSLKELIIPENVKKIGGGGFFGSGITDFIMPDSVTDLGKNESGYSSYFGKSLVSIKLSKNITELPDYFFYGCENLKSVTIPDGVTSIGESAFNNCKSIQSITIPDGVTSIGSSSFENCESIQSITIPDSVTSIGDSAFANCKSIQSIKIPDSVTSVGGALFVGCKNLQTVKFSENLTDLGNSFHGQFEYCDKMTSVTLPDSLVKIPSYSFSDCNTLTEIKLGSKVKTIENCSFENCTKLENIIIPDTMEEMGYKAFNNCKSLTEVKIESGKIGCNAFTGCDNLASVHIGKNVISLKPDAFSGCGSLVSFEIDSDNNSLKSLNNSLVSFDCKTLIFVPEGLAEYTIPDGIEKIDVCCFAGNEKLREIKIPDSVKSISEEAFKNCKCLKDITINENTEFAGKGIFIGCDNITIHGKTGSAAEVYARQHGNTFSEI